ncbi:MAG: family transcriptional regulator [Bacillales bacterium]|jgi:cytoskeletal protein RodZ|nr:family transcriptional regulator [Bacillales bacterium]
MENIGQVLRLAREEKGISLDQLQEKTKIQKRYLSAIENNEFGLLPGKFYVRAFIRLYADEVGINVEALLKEFSGQIQTSLKEENINTFSRVQTQKSIPINHSKWLELLPKIVLILFIIALSIFIYFLISKYDFGSTDNNPKDDGSGEVLYDESNKVKDKDKDKDSENSTDSDENPSDNKGEEEVIEVPKQTVTLLSSDGRNSVFEVKNSSQLMIKIASTGSAWISVKKQDSGSVYQGILKAPEFKEFDLTGNKEATIVTGKSVETQVYVNGEEILFNTNNTGNVTQTIIIKVAE